MTRSKAYNPAEVLSRITGWNKTGLDHERTGCFGGCFLEAEHLPSAARTLLAEGFFLEAISGVDVAEGMMLVYHFDRFDTAARLALRVIVPHQEKCVPSIAGIYSGADWHERECFDFFGIRFEGHPNLKPLLLPDELGVNPLVKEQGRKSVYGLLPFNHVAGGSLEI